jgi:enoyl-CoA hydratase
MTDVRSAADQRVRYEVDGPIATITNDNTAKHNAFDDAMDLRLFEIFGEIAGGAVQLTHHELMTRGHRGIQQVLDLEVPVIVATQGWSIGASFQRALLCDIRVAAQDARFMLPEVAHGVIPDTGGVARLFQICGHGVASDLVLTGRPIDAAEAHAHGIVSRVVPREELDATVREMAEKIAAAPYVTVRMARRVLRHLSEPQVRTSMAEELIAQTFVNSSRDYAEFRAARSEKRTPRYTGS